VHGDAALRILEKEKKLAQNSLLISLQLVRLKVESTETPGESVRLAGVPKLSFGDTANGSGSGLFECQEKDWSKKKI
jgi:hypothetical protein